MSKQIDERVVEMRFDNKQFESGVKDTMSTLDKFKQSLKLKDATKGLDDLEAAARKVDLNPLTRAAETVTAKFSALQVVGVTALANITNSAINAGENIVKAFTLDPVISGFQEYETQINAVQTILANTESKGSTLQDVNAALNELNKYADMTIYNFTEMTRNIGTFTAAGVDLKTSVSAIKGIANLAAVSGSTSLQASTAMYQLSQALAAGKVSLMDWNSVVNAGMGGQVFQDALMETARVHGVAIDAMIKKRGSFRETLQDGWLTAEVLTETLSKFTGDLSEAQLKQMGYTEEQIAGIIKMGKTANDAATKVKTFTQLFDTLKEAAQSGWTRSWEILIGDFGEAKEFLTSISDSLSDILNKSADARNTVLSGGLSSGWKQLLNAGIADEEGYKESLKSVVNEHGTSIDEMIKAEQKLDESLTDTEAFQKVLKKGLAEGTLTSDMFSESVHKMADKMSNMSAKELEAAGYTKDHVEQIKALSNGLKDGSISMDEFVKKMGRSSGRENLIEALWNSFDGLLSVIKPIKEAFREVFPATTGEQLYRLTERIRDFTATLKLSDEQAANLKSTFKGVFSVVKIGVTIIKSIVSGFATLIGKITGLSGGFLEITGSLGDWISGVAESINETNLFGKAIDKVVGFLGLAIDKFKEFTGALKGKIASPGFEWFFNLLSGIWEVVQKIGKAIGQVFSGIGKAIGTAFQNGDIKSLLDILNSGLFATILLGIKKYISGITEAFESPMKLIDNIKDVLGSVEESLKSWQQNLQSGTIKNIAIAIGILAASLWVLSGIDSGKLGTALGAITVLFGELLGAMALLTKIGGIGKGAISSITTMIGMSAAVLILASALKKLSDLKWGEIGRGLTGVLGLMTILVAAAKVMSHNSEKIKKGAMQMVIMAAALKILASVCKDLSELSWVDLAKGVSGITAILLAFAGFQALMKKIQPNKMLSSATSLILIGAAMKILASVAKDFSEMEWTDLGKAGAAIAGILVIAAGFGKLSSYAGKMVSSSIALILIGKAMGIFADISEKFGKMEWKELAKAGSAIGGVLILASGFALLSGLSKGMFWSVVALTIMAAAMEIFADICNKFGQMKWEELGKAGAAIGGILALATGFALLAGLSNGMLASAAALLVMAAALKVLTPVLTTLGQMSIGEIAKSLITLSAALGILIGAAALITYLGLIPALFALGGAVALFGVACLAAGAGILALSTGFTALAASGVAGATALVAALTVIIVGILQLIPTIVNVLTDAVVALCNVIIQSAPAIGEAVKTLVLTVIDVLVECIPALADGLFKMILGVLDALTKYTPQLVTKLFEILIGIVESAAAALGAIDPETFLKGLAAMTGLMVALNAMTLLAAGAMIGVLAFGAVIVELAAVLATIGGLAQIPGLEWLISEGGDFLQKVGTAIGQFVGGILGGIAEGVTSAFPQIATNLSDFMTNLAPFIEGAKMIDESVLTNVQTLVGIILALTGASILEGLTSWLTGGSSIVDFGKQMAEFGPYIKQFADSVSGINPESVTAAANAGKMLAEMAAALPNSGGVAGFFAGENDIDNFGSKLKDFGTAIADFSAEVDGKVSESSVSAAVNAGKLISELAEALPNSGGVAGFFAGENDISNFAPKLKDFGTAIADFSAAVDGKVNESSVTAAVNAGKMISELASSLPDSGGVAGFFAGNNDMDVFGEQLTKFGTGIADFSDSVSGKVSGIDSSVASIQKLLSMLENVSGTNAEAIASFKKSLSDLGKTSIKGFIKSFDDADKKAKAAVSKFLKGVSSSVTSAKESLYTKFAMAGLHLVNGFVKGITENTFKAEAKARAMANAAYEAARKALDEHSPSKKFMKMGAFVVAGFANGIAKNVGDANEASVKMANGVLESTMDALGIHSPSVVFDKKVGRYIVQGIAEGIKKDMSAEEAAEKKAQNIVSAFQNALDSIDRSMSNRSKKFNLWLLTDGKTSSDATIVHEQMKQLNDDLYSYNEKVKLAKGEWETFKNDKKYGPNNKYTEEAYGKMLDAQVKAAETASAIIALQDSLVTSEEELIEKNMSLKQKDKELWALMDESNPRSHETITDEYNQKYYQQMLEDRIKLAEIAQKEYDTILASGYDKNHTKALEALEKLKDAKIAVEQAKNDIFDYDQSVYDRDIQKLEEQVYQREKESTLWELTNGEDASSKDRYLFYRKQYDEDLKVATQEKEVAIARYEDFIKAYAKENKVTEKMAQSSDRAKALWDEVKDKRIAEEEAKKKVRDIDKDYLEEEKEDLKTQLQTSSDIAELRYQIWEKTSGRKAKDAEKDTMKLALLTEQLGAQAELVKMAEKAWKEATEDEKQQLEKEYLSAQLELANLQSEVLDIQEENTKRQERALDRQRLAQTEYADYIKKYEKYYLENGMTMEELEKDARLVSGYDPSNAVSSMVSKTNTSLDNLTNNTQYKDLLSNFSNMGTEYATAVSEGIQNGISTVTDNTTTMVKACVDKIQTEKESWFKAGVSLVEKFIEGLKSKINDSVNAAIELASRTLTAIKDICESDMDYTPRIVPVLDMSEVSSGVGTLNTMLSGRRSLNLASSIAKGTLYNETGNSGSSQTSEPVYTFTQNNYSPKALSSIEIYRQTNNMISKIGKKVTR